MLRRTARLRREYLYRKSLEARAAAAHALCCTLPQLRSDSHRRAQGEERVAYEKKRAIRKALEGAPRGPRRLASRAPSSRRLALRASLRRRQRPRPALRRAEGKPIPTELLAEEAALRNQASLEDVRTAAVSTHVDDEYARAGEEDPRIMLTTSRNPSTRLTAFVKELKLVFPNCTRLNRGGQVVKEMVESCRAGGYSDIIVVHEHRGEPDGLVVCHLPFGPTAYFGLMNCVARHDIKDTALGTVSEAYPHLILEARCKRRMQRCGVR